MQFCILYCGGFMIKKSVYVLIVIIFLSIGSNYCIEDNLNRKSDNEVLFPNLKKVSKEFISIFRIDPLERSAGKVKDKLLKGFYINKNQRCYINEDENLLYLNFLKKKRAFPVKDIVKLDNFYDKKDYFIDLIRFKKIYFQSIKVIGLDKELNNIKGIKIAQKGVNRKRILLIGGINKDEIDTTIVLMEFIDQLLQKKRLRKNWGNFSVSNLLKNVDIIVLPKISDWESCDKEGNSKACEYSKNHICSNCNKNLIDKILKKFNPDLTIFYHISDGNIGCNFTKDSILNNIEDRIFIKDLCELTGYKEERYKLDIENDSTEKYIRNNLEKNVIDISLKKNNDISITWDEIELSFPYLLKYAKNINLMDFDFEPLPFRKSIILNHQYK
jgi:hypothetical protein